MKVKKIIANALKILGRSSLAASAEAGETLAGEEKEAVQTLLFCYNAVENELSQKGFPLITEENLSSVSGIYYFNSFSLPVARILSVKAGGAEVNYALYPLYMRVNAPFVTVTYAYPPAGKQLEDDSAYGGEIGERALSYGVLAEYFLINGEASDAELWEERYRGEISRLKLKLHGDAVAPRRWI